MADCARLEGKATTLDRRGFLRAAAGAGGLLVARSAAAGAQSVVDDPTDHFPTSRASRLFPDSGQFVVHSDLHNHSLLSDGAAAADDWFDIMRSAGVDVAALTDHAVLGKLHGDVTCSKVTPIGDQCSPYVGINETSWDLLQELADAANDPGAFVGMRGFEWTTGSRGHVNVWFSEQWIDALLTGSITEIRDADTLFDAVLGVELPPEIVEIIDTLPSTASIDGFWDWLEAPVGSLPLGGGADALAGLNHPNEFGNFENFKLFPAVAERVVSIEAFNGPAHADVPLRDFWSWDVEAGQPWPINAALNAGWRTGLIGVSDNHTDIVGDPRAARGGLWVTGLTRAGVREAMEQRRMFASRYQGLRLDASAHGVPMGSDVSHPGGALPIVVDLDWGPDSWGEPVVIEVAGPGSGEPRQLAAVPATVPGPADPVFSFTLDVDPDDVPWLLLRICQPGTELDPNVVEGPWTAHGAAIAYSSPWWLQRGETPGPVGNSAGEPTPTTGAGSGLLAGGLAIAAAAVAARRGHHHAHDNGEGRVART